MTKKALSEGLRKIKRGELSAGTPHVNQYQTPAFVEEIWALNVPHLQKIANRHGLPYTEIKGMKKKDLVEFLVSAVRKTEEIDIESVDDFTNKGGSIKKIKSQLLPKVTPPVHNSAVPHEQKGRWGYGEVKKKIKKVKAKPARADNPDGITLQSILLEFGVKGTTARKALRVSDIKKPGKQWVWDKTDKVSIKAVRKFIKHLT